MLSGINPQIERVETRMLRVPVRLSLQLPPFLTKHVCVAFTCHFSTESIEKCANSFEKALLSRIGKEDRALEYAADVKKQLKETLTIIVGIGME